MFNIRAIQKCHRIKVEFQRKRETSSLIIKLHSLTFPMKQGARISRFDHEDHGRGRRKRKVSLYANGNNWWNYVVRLLVYALDMCVSCTFFLCFRRVQPNKIPDIVFTNIYNHYFSKSNTALNCLAHVIHAVKFNQIVKLQVLVMVAVVLSFFSPPFSLICLPIN